MLVAAEVSRLARSTLQVLELLQAAAERGVTVHIAKNRMVLDQSLPATITATILGLAAQIEREFISARTKEALERRKAAGLPVGRPKGRATKLMLDDRRAEIVDYLNKGVSKRSVAKILGCSPTTLYSWIRRRRNSTVLPCPSTARYRYINWPRTLINVSSTRQLPPTGRSNRRQRFSHVSA